MICPFCRKENDRVVDSRPLERTAVIRRRRECIECHRRFTTYERLEEMPRMVIKQSGSREPYDRHKLRKGILRACEKRPISSEDIERIVSDIDLKLQEYLIEIPSQKIGEMALEHLLEVDPVAYVRFASVYRKFNSIDVFFRELKRLKAGYSKKRHRGIAISGKP